MGSRGLAHESGVRAADLKPIVPLLSGFSGELEPYFNERFDWTYREGLGTAGLWVLEDEATKRILWELPRLPTPDVFRRYGNRGYVLGDFWHSPAFRAAGPRFNTAQSPGTGQPRVRWYDFQATP
jgi:hypothetical protein